MEIEPATISQVKKAGDDWIVIEDDVVNIARDLKEIDERLCLRHNKEQGFYAIFARDGEKEYLVNTMTSLNPQVIERIKQIVDSSYNYMDELEQLDKQGSNAREFVLNDKIRDSAERLAHAIRKDLGMKDRAYFK